MRALLVISWFFIFVTSAFLVVLAIVSLLTYGPSPAGPPASLAGVANLIALGVAAISFVVAIISYLCRPRHAMSALRLALSAVINEHSPRGGGFAGCAPASGDTASTDDAGLSIIRTDRRHASRRIITCPGFLEVTFYLDRDWGGGQHQTTLSWRDSTGAYRSPRTGDSLSVTILVPAGMRSSFTVYLPRRANDPLSETSGMNRPDHALQRTASACHAGCSGTRAKG